MKLFSVLKRRILSHPKDEPLNNPTVHPLDEFFKTTVDNIMIPRSDIVAVSSQTPFHEVVRTFLKTGFLWLPVFRDTLDTITGIVSIHCVLSLREVDNPETQWYRHLNAPTFCPSSMSVYEAMRLIQHHHKNPLVFVVDEYGGIQGMVTKGYMIRELFYLYAEDLSEDEEMILQKDPMWVLDGRMDLETFAEEFHAHTLFSAEDENRVHTLGGWLCAYVGRVPLTGEIIAHPSGFTFEIRQASPRRIQHIALIQTPAAML